MARTYTGGEGVTPDLISGSSCAMFLPESEDEVITRSANKVFRNSLIVSLICSYKTSVTNLLNFRQVNHVFQQEATKKLKAVHKHVSLKSETCIQEFLCCMKNREFLKLTPFPFSAFKVTMRYRHLNIETLDTFSSVICPHINCNSIQVFEFFKREWQRRVLTGSPESVLKSEGRADGNFLLQLDN